MIMIKGYTILMQHQQTENKNNPTTNTFLPYLNSCLQQVYPDSFFALSKIQAHNKTEKHNH